MISPSPGGNVVWEISDGSTRDIISSNQSMNLDEWYFLASTWDGNKMKMVKLLSGFSITGCNDETPEAVPDSDPDDQFAGMDPAKSSELMKELESSIAGMDDENPDPKQMGTLMRKMCEYSGERMDEPMEEVIRKLEEGMNPEELEDRMGDFMGETIMHGLQN